MARPTIHIIGRELEALRIDIMQGKAGEATPQVEDRLNQVKAWWQQYRSGQAVPDAPDPEVLSRTLISALDIAKNAHIAQKDWKTALRYIDAKLEVKRALKRPAEDITGDRMNRAIALSILERVGEAKAELEACLQVFQNDPARRARTLNSLAAVFYAQGDIGQAIVQQRRGLALFEQLPDPSERAASHHNLANYLLERSVAPSDLAESHLHQFAALAYRAVAGLGQDLQDSLGTYAIDFRRAQSDGVPLTLPRVAELLADPAFRPLDDWLRQRQVDITEVQTKVNQELEQAKQAASEQK